MLGVAQGAGVYRWVDDDGRVHYTDRAPGAAIETEQVTIAPAPPTDEALSRRRDRRQRLLEAIEQDRSQRLGEAEAQREEGQRRVRNCELARRSLEQFQRANVLYIEEENGERRYLDDEHRARTLEVLRRRERERCAR